MAEVKTAIILAGGLGTRLRPLTLEIPKPLIPIQGKSLTEHVMDKLLEAGVETIYLSIGYMKDQIINYIEKLKEQEKYKNINIKYLIEDKPLGTGGCLKLIDEKDLKDDFDDDFIVVNGDNLFDLDWEEITEFHKNTDSLVTVGLTNIDDVSNYGVANIEEGRIKEFIEKPSKEDAPSDLINAGYYVFSPEVFDFIRKELSDKEKFMLEKDLFPALAEKGRLYGYNDKGQWFDTGTFERWQEVIENWKK